MTPNNKTTIGSWLVLDDKGDTWRVQCLACGRSMPHSKRLLQSAFPPRCKCGGKVSAKPVEPSKQPAPAVVPTQPVAAAVGHPVADALFGIFGMVPVAPGVKEPQPPKKPKPSRQRLATRVEVGQVIHRLTVLGDAPTFAGRAMVTCRCECGQVKNVLRWHLAKGNIQSCGCAKDSPEQTRHNMRTVALPGDVFGSLVVVEEAPKQGKNRTVVAECRHCSMRWRVAIQNLRRTTDVCSCAMRWAVSAAGIDEARRVREAQKAKRLDYDRLRKCRELDRQIRSVEVRLAILRAKRESLTPPATVAP